jgi:FkbM family methyltransferase
MTVVDVGANKGDYSLLSAYLMKDKGKIFAIEPVPENCYWLKKSIKANNFKSIKVCEIALSDKNGKAKLYLDKIISGGASLKKFDGSEEVLNIRVQKMDDLIKNKVDVIKIDVQGTELNVLKGARKTMKHNTHIFIDLDNPKTKIKVWELLKDNGYEIYSIGKNLTLVDDIKDVDSIYGVRQG